MLREILEFRRAEGNPLQGTLLEDLGDPGAEGEFLEALRDAASAAPEPHPAQVSSAAVCPNACAHPVPQQPVRQGPEDPLIGALRLASRQLDLKAAELEDRGQYGEADTLRALARQLRKHARRWSDPEGRRGVPTCRAARIPRFLSSSS